MKPIPQTCDRCGDALRASIMSKFNTDTLCMPCKSDEEALPCYPAAVDAERIACLRGDYNFLGIGLTAEDRASLAARRAARGRS